MVHLQFKGQKLIALLKLYFSKYSKKGTSGSLCDFEKEMGYRNGNPSIRELFKHLIKNNILIKEKEFKGIDYYYIDKNKIKEVIREQEILNLHNKYLDRVGIVWATE